MLTFEHGLFDRADYEDATSGQGVAAAGVPGVRTAAGMVPVCRDRVRHALDIPGLLTSI